MGTSKKYSETRDEALNHEWIKDVFHITDHMVKDDKVIVSFFHRLKILQYFWSVILDESIYFRADFMRIVVIILMCLCGMSAYAQTKEMATEFATDSDAYLDEEKCPNYPLKALVGKWYGETEIKGTGQLQKWVNTRSSDGKYRIEFSFYHNGMLVGKNTEEGLWSYSGCLYSIIVKKVDSKPVLYQEVYRLHEVTRSKMRYTNYRTGNTFTMKKVK